MFQTNTIQADTKILDIMPVIGFGTWEITGKSCIESVKDAIHMGYRHIDTAQMYTNEKEVGKGIRQSGIEREELFVTTKIATNNLKPDLIRKTAIESLTRLNMDYVDLLLIHWPTPDMDLRACLETMFELKEQKRIKHVGVSNFDPELFEQAIEIGPVINNQVKFTPHHTQMDNLAVARKHNKIITAYSPLERGSIVKDSTLEEIGKEYNKTGAQVALRYLIQLGNVSVIPKAESKEHRRDNFNIFDFDLSEEEMDRIEE